MIEKNTTVALSKIGQIAISVSDMEKAIAFYRDQVGLHFLFQAPNVAFFDCGGIRLMLGKNEQPGRTPFGTCIYFSVPDIHQAFEVLKSREVPIVSDPHLVAKMPKYDLWIAFLRDPDENNFALMCEIPT